AAAQAAFFDNTEFERGAAVAAVPVQEPDPAALVAEQHQILAEDAHCQRHVLEFGRHRHRLPKTAQILATRRPRTDMGQFGVLAWHFTLVIAAVRLTDGLLALPGHALPPGDAAPLSRVL